MPKETDDDKLKIQLLDKIDDDFEKANIICSLSDDETKVALLDKIKNSYAKGHVIASLSSDDKKIELMKTMKLPNKSTIISKLKDDVRKIELLDELETEQDKARVISSITDIKMKNVLLSEISDEGAKAIVIRSILMEDESQIGLLDKLTSGEKRIWVIRALSTEKKIELLDGLSDENKAEIISSIGDDEKKIELLDKLTSENAKVAVILELSDVKKKQELLDKLDDKKIQTLDNIEDDLEKLQVIINVKNRAKKQELLATVKDTKYVKILEILSQTNNEVLDKIDVRLLQEKYTQTLGLDKINLISCYPNTQQQILNLSDKEYNVFQSCLKGYLETNKTDEWNVLADNILQNINEYAELIENIDDLEKIDIAKLTKIIQDKNTFQIKKSEDIENYEQIKREQCDKIIESSQDVQQVKEAVMQKIFGHSFEYAKMIVEKFGEDIENIAAGDEKDYVMSLKEMIKVDQIDVLHQIYAECSEIELIDKTLMERSLKTEYGKLFNEGLWEPQDSYRMDENEFDQMMQGDGDEQQVALYEELKKLNLYNAGTDFKMMVTSVAPLLQTAPLDYKEDWNRPSIASHHFCASYIRNDSIKTFGVPYLCYGFTHMKDDALVLSGAIDMGSTGVSSFVSRASRDEKYYSPDNLIENTDVYNEMDYRRIQGGVKKQPDYIVAFKRNGKIANIKEIIKASKNWEGSLPIVIVDVDEYEKEQARETKEEIREQVVDIQDLEENDNQINAEERQGVISQIKQLYNKLKEVVMKREGANNGR